MPTRLAVLALLLSAARLAAADTPAPASPAEPAPAAAEPAEHHSSISDLVKAKMLQDARKAPAKDAKTPPPKKSDKDAAVTGSTSETSASPGAASAPGTTPAAAKAEPATVLPKVEVRRERITVLDQKIAEQERDIAREKKNTKPTEVDAALNGPAASKALSIFGGESSSYRANVAKERVSLMESERDILEAMKSARTKEEKAELQKQLDEIRAMRRELEKSLRQ
jgi:hypothetical protein